MIDGKRKALGVPLAWSPCTGWLGAVLVFGSLGCSGERAAPEERHEMVEQWSCAAGAVSEAPMRRLTRFEYSNTVSDVFGLTLDFDGILPRDEIALGFDNQAGALSVTDLHVEGFMKAAERVSDAVIQAPGRLAEIAGCHQPSRSCAEQTARALGRLLLRRTLTRPDVDRLMVLFDDDYTEPGYQEGTARVISALLQAPEFLYRIERLPNTSAPASAAAGDDELTLSPTVVASRLSFLIWGGGPDAELLDVVARGGLSTRQDIAKQASKMLTDERARRGILHFFEQWLDLSSFDEVEKDRRLFPAWDDEVRDDLARETRRFLKALLWEDDARFSTLLTARYSFLTPVLMDFYGVPITGSDPEKLERIDWGDSQARMGILTQGAVMSHLAKANQTDPIHRGKFIRERFFCTSPPPPPPNLVVSPPELDPRKTTRERFEQHRTNPVCASCHQLLDPVGLAFEHYDALGRYRDSEAGVPIDASGELVDTDVDGPLEGVPELVNRLSESTEVSQCIVKQVFRYAFGRAETERDACALDKLEQQFRATDGDLIELLIAVTQIDPFVSEAPAPPAEVEL